LLGQKVAFLYCRRILNVLLVLLQQLLVVRCSMLGYKLGCLTRLGRQLLQLCRHQICKRPSTIRSKVNNILHYSWSILIILNILNYSAHWWTSNDTENTMAFWFALLLVIFSIWFYLKLELKKSLRESN
jgi:hypothetical protein